MRGSERIPKNPTFNADLYVFCLNIEKHPERFNAFNLEQWRFFLSCQVSRLQKSIKIR